MIVRSITVDEIDAVVGAIDRSESVDREVEVVDGALRDRPVHMAEIPDWTDDDGEHSRAGMVRFAREVVDAGGIPFVACHDETVLGVLIVNPTFEPPLSWFALLHVSRAHRRRGVASMLWRTAVEESRAAGAERMYVSATPTGSAVGFYLRQGCVLADPPHPALFEHEPDDVHLILDL
jgi:predicted N-acetyltransferase YhbS